MAETVVEPKEPASPDAMPSGEALRLSGVGKTFPDGTEALADVTLTVDRGEFVAVVGPSGCGKSTLLRLASGLTAATGGRVDADAATTGYVFQDPTLLPWRSVRRNVELSAELAGLPRAERRERAAGTIARVGLADFARHRPGALSGGMKMRVSLARALVLRPELFLFDEPFGALDSITRDRLCEDLQGLFDAERFAAVFVTHSVAEAVYLSTRVAVMSDRPGRIVAEVPIPFDYPRAPSLRFDAKFTRIVADVSSRLGGALGGGR
jgi:NitT/TauT family transport system ATP-binding protein